MMFMQYIVLGANRPRGRIDYGRETTRGVKRLVGMKRLVGTKRLGAKRQGEEMVHND